MRYLFVVLTIVLVSVFSSCNKEVYSDVGYIVGFDPCTGGFLDNENKGFIIITEQSKDTLLTYNLPPDIFTFPNAYFANYWYVFLFPDSAKYDYKISFEYSFTEENDKVASFCVADIYLGDFNYFVRNRQVILISARKY